MKSDATRILESQARLRCAELAAEESFGEIVASVIEQMQALGVAPLAELAALSVDEVRSHVALCEQALACLCQEYGVRTMRSVEELAPELFPEYEQARSWLRRFPDDDDDGTGRGRARPAIPSRGVQP